MPKPEEHDKLSMKRSGKSFLELHKWLDGENCIKIHDIVQIRENIAVIKEKFGEESITEFLYHLKEDYENKHKLIPIIKSIFS